MYDMQDIYMGNLKVGQASCKIQGLYHLITCRCNLPANEIHRLEIRYADKTVPLGVCVPVDGVHCLRKSIVSKQLGSGPCKICVAGRQNEIAVPIDPQKTVDYLSKLEHARLRKQNGVALLCIVED